jgi:hypothetical protein
MKFFDRFLSRKSRHTTKTTRSGRRNRFGSRLRLESLEQRALLHGVGASTSDPATHLALFAPQNVIAGNQTGLEVVALDASNHIARSYTGTVSFASTGSSGDTLPSKYTFAGSDHGIHIFLVTFNTSGPQTLTATDGGGLTGSATVNVIAPPTSAGGGSGILGGLVSLLGHGNPSSAAAAGHSRGIR